MDILAQRLRQWRNERQVSQNGIAIRLAVDRSTYAKYEGGRVDPSLPILCRLADVLGCSVDWLLGRE